MKKILIFAIVTLVACKKEETQPSSSISNSNYNPNPYAEQEEQNILNSNKHLKLYQDGVEWRVLSNQDYFQMNNISEKITASNNSTTEPIYSTEIFLSSASSNEATNGKYIIKFKPGTCNYVDYMNSDDLFYSHMNVGDYTFLDNNLSNSIGIEVIYIDNNGKIWSSANGVQNQASFSVSSSVSNVNSINIPYKTLKGTFSCKLFDSETPQSSKVLSNGDFYMDYYRP